MRKPVPEKKAQRKTGATLLVAMTGKASDALAAKSVPNPARAVKWGGSRS
jgi:hypothetical protein